MTKLLAIRNPVIPIIWGENVSGDNAGLGSIISILVSTIIVFGFLLTLLYLIWGAIDWLTSGGEEEKLKIARNKITNAVIGMVLLIAVWAIWNLLKEILGLSLELPTP